MKRSRSPSSTASTLPHLDVRAVVLDALLGVEGVGADLAAEVDLRCSPRERRELLLALLPLVLVEPRAQHLHRRRPVLVLRALVLALHHDAGRDVGQAHGGVGLVHVLPARAARAVGVDAQVLLLDLDLDGVVELGQTETLAKAVCRRAWESKGEMRTSRWTPSSAFR